MGEFKRKYADLATGLALVLWGILGFHASYGIRVAPGVGNISATTGPRVVSALLGILGLVLAARGYRQYRLASAEDAAGAATPWRDEFRKIARVLLIVAILVGYTLLLRPVGFALCTPALIFLTGLALATREERSVAKLAAVAIVATGVIYFVFVWGFNVRLPMGVLR